MQSAQTYADPYDSRKFHEKYESNKISAKIIQFFNINAPPLATLIKVEYAFSHNLSKLIANVSRIGTTSQIVTMDKNLEKPMTLRVILLIKACF